MKLLDYLSLVAILLCAQMGSSQTEVITLDLKQTIVLAQSDAPDVLIEKTRLSNRFWIYQSFLADFKPQITLGSSELPLLVRAISPITQPSGDLTYINQSFMRNSAEISLQQNIPQTGGSVSLNSSFERLDLFGRNEVSYISTPINVRFNQPLFQFNPFKWDKQIQPLRFEESKRAYSEGMEEVAFNAANLFFDVLIAQFGVSAAEKNKADADTLFRVSQGRFNVGRIAETDLLQIELNVRNADAALAQAGIDLQSSTEQLRDFLGIQQAVNFTMIPPTDIPQFEIDPERALNHALANRSDILTFERQKIDAERSVAEAKGTTGFRANIGGTFGLSQTGATIQEAYENPLDQELLQVDFRIPLADWGKRQSRLQIAESNRELVEQQVERDRISFEREIILKVQQFDLVRDQVALAERAYEVAQKRNEITRQRYLIGKIGITDLNLALSEQENARISYISALRRFWIAYYDIRRLTLFDFETNQPLKQSIAEEELD